MSAQLLTAADKIMQPTLEALALSLKKDFIIGGSYITHCLAQLAPAPIPNLVYNDIDVYRGEFGHGPIKRVDYTEEKVPGVDVEVNFIDCTGLSLESMGLGVDLNVVDGCVHVVCHPDGGIMDTRWRVGPHLWHFLLGGERVIRSCGAATPAQTIVRAAHKSMQTGLPFACPGLAVTEGVLFASHRRKIKEMSTWCNNPFTHLEVRYKEDNAWHFVPMTPSTASPSAAAPKSDSLYHVRDPRYPAGPTGKCWPNGGKKRANGHWQRAKQTPVLTSGS
jgi:hypothetical protein